MSIMYVVHVQHPCIELESGKVIPNFKFVGTVLAYDGEEALTIAKATFCDVHCPALLTVEPLED